MENAGRVSRKDEIKQIVSASMELATTRDEFFRLLEDDDLKIYERNGEPAGIEDIRNFRFSTLGADLSELDARENRLKELEGLDTDRELHVEKSDDTELTIEQQRMNELDELGREESFRE